MFYARAGRAPAIPVTAQAMQRLNKNLLGVGLMSEQVSEKKGRRGKTQIVIILLLLLVIGGLIFAIVQIYLASHPKTPDYEREVAAKLGQLEGKSEAEIQAELDRVVEEGMFHISINTNPVFYDGTSEGNLEIENVPSNLYLMRVEITDNETGDLLYSTKYIEPNNHIQKAALDKELAAGAYPATATFYAYDPETLTEMGSTACEITLYVQN
jgi:hypothetical protein